MKGYDMYRVGKRHEHHDNGRLHAVCLAPLPTRFTDLKCTQQIYLVNFRPISAKPLQSAAV